MESSKFTVDVLGGILLVTLLRVAIFWLQYMIHSAYPSASSTCWERGSGRLPVLSSSNWFRSNINGVCAVWSMFMAILNFSCDNNCTLYSIIRYANRITNSPIPRLSTGTAYPSNDKSGKMMPIVCLLFTKLAPGSAENKARKLTNKFR